MEKGITSVLVKDEKTGELVCRTNSSHKFKTDESGFLKTLPER